MIFSQRVSDLCVQNNITNDNIDELTFDYVFSFSSKKSSVDEDIKRILSKYCARNRKGCIFSIPYDNNYIVVYCSKLSETELVKIIKLKAFW
jgi:hypothetical protein